MHCWISMWSAYLTVFTSYPRITIPWSSLKAASIAFSLYTLNTNDDKQYSPLSICTPSVFSYVLCIRPCKIKHSQRE